MSPDHGQRVQGEADLLELVLGEVGGVAEDPEPGDVRGGPGPVLVH